MKYKFITILILFTSLYFELLSQNCMTLDSLVTPVISPIASPIAVSTMGWVYDSSLSIEFDSGSLTGDWYFASSPNYQHGNADNYFSDDSTYWDLSGGILTLKLDDDPNGGYDYTAAILCNDSIDRHYGYYEIRAKIPEDEDLCTSLWFWHDFMQKNAKIHAKTFPFSSTLPPIYADKFVALSS
jgi:hypothetical protein